MGSSLFFLFLSMLTHSISTTAATATATATATVTATLYVGASVQKTLNLQNSTLLEEQSEKTQTETTSSPLSFTIHPRSSIDHNQQHHDYESLTLARLARDSQQVASIITRLNRAISQTNKSEMKKPGVETNSMYNVVELTTPVTSDLLSGEYFARVGLGTPVQLYYLLIDTGSDITWLQCLPCSHCYQQTDLIYNPSGSSTYNALPCTSHQCESLENSTCQSTRCLYQITYLDESSTAGDLVTETVSFGNSGSLRSVAIGCSHDNEGLFVAAAGLLGLGRGPLSFPSQIKATSFSYCLVEHGSNKSSTLEFNSAPPANSVTVPLLQNPQMKTYYYVGLTGILVGKRRLPIPPSIFAIDDSGRGGAIVDSGTIITRLPSQAYNALRDAFTQQAVKLKPTDGYSKYDTCFDFSSFQNVEDVPKVAFTFAGGKTLWLKMENCLILVDLHGKVCLAFLPTTDSLSIIGNHQQQGIRVTYDMSKSVVSFSPNSC